MNERGLIMAKTPRAMPEALRKRQPGGEELRFRWAFAECLRLRPDRAPTPNDLNALLDSRPPHNILAGRLSTLRKELLLENGFVKTNDSFHGHWVKRGS